MEYLTRYIKIRKKIKIGWFGSRINLNLVVLKEKVQPQLVNPKGIISIWITYVPLFIIITASINTFININWLEKEDRN